MARLPQTALGAATALLGVLMAAGATQISSDAGYAGVGPNFLPWVVGLALTLCGLWLIWEARTGGYRDMEEPSGADTAHWPGFVWVSVGLLLNALLIEHVGFILSCTLCFVLAVRGFRSAEGRTTRGRRCERRGSGRADRRSGVLDVHQAAGHQPAWPDPNRLALSCVAGCPRQSVRADTGLHFSFFFRGDPSWTSGTTC